MRLKKLAAVAATSLLCGSVFAQDTGYTASSVSNSDSGSGAVTLQVLGGGLTVFNDLASFQAAAPDATNSEDFEDATGAAPGGVTVCVDPVDSTTNDACFTPGDIVDGISIATDNGNGIVLLGAGFNGLASNVAGALTFADTTDLSFTGTDIQAVAFDAFAGLAASDVVLSVFDTTDTLIGTATVAGLGALPASGFIGIISDQPIGRINLDSLGGNGELFDNLLFGPLPPPPPALEVPTMSQIGMILMALGLAAFGFVTLRRREFN